MRSNSNSWVCVLLVLWSRASADHRHPMEDAVTEKDVHRVCRRDGPALLCRLEDLQESELDLLDPCLCTHLIYTEKVKVPDRWRHSGVKSLLSTSLVRWRRETSLLLSEFRRGHFHGVDITVGREADPTDTRILLQEVRGLLQGASSPQENVISLTFLEGGLPELILSGMEPFQFVTDFGGTDSLFKEVAIPRHTILYGVSVEDLWKHVAADSKLSRKCAEIPTLNTDEDGGSKMKNIINKIHRAVENNELGGLHIRSVVDDDTSGICNAGGPFPILRLFRNKLSSGDQQFGNFADLDIVLSTGESQNVQFVLDTPREDLKKLPCARVGFYRHPMDCTKFYHCSEYRATAKGRRLDHQSGPYAGFLYQCPVGLVYDERQGSCIWPSWSDPCRGSGELLPVPAKKFSCVTPGFHVDPENCRYFYYCSDLGDSRQLEAFEFLCPSDLLGFDEVKLLCNWKWTVAECSGNVSSHGKERYSTSKALDFENVPSAPSFDISLEKNIVIKNETTSNESDATINDTMNTSYAAPVSVNYIPNEKQYDGKFGTAIWRRPGVDTPDNSRRNNNLELSVHNRAHSYYIEPEKPFKGRVTKLDLGGNSESRLAGKKRNDEISKNYELKRQEFTTMNQRDPKNDVLFQNAANDGDDADILSGPKPSPFMNVKCSKLAKENVNTLGCTGEVSLTIKLNRGKDSNKYILRNDQIIRTYQESQQQVSHLKSPAEKDKTIDKNNKNQGDSERKSVTPASFSLLESHNVSVDLSPKAHRFHSDNFPFTQKTDDDLTKKSDNLKVELAQRSPNHFPLTQTTDYDFTKKSNNLNVEPAQYSPNHFSLTQTTDYDLTKKSDNLNVQPAEYSSEPPFTKRPLNTDEERFLLEHAKQKAIPENTPEHKSESTPIHFYPQGVLLNINLARVTQLPPDILIEVDHMLKKYMDGGRIDANLLGEKLNASVEKMTPEKHDESPEPEEIMDVIRVIENIINPSRVDYSQDDKTDTTTLQTLRENGSTSGKNVSTEKLQREMSKDPFQNTTKTRSFGRRKFKSIREQIDQQISNRRGQSKIETDNPPYTYPLAFARNSDKAMRTSFSRLPIHHASLPSTSNDNAIQTSASPFKGQLRNEVVHQDYKSPTVVAAQNDRQDRYLQRVNAARSMNLHEGTSTFKGTGTNTKLQQDFDGQRFGNAPNIPPNGGEYTPASKNEHYETYTREPLAEPSTSTEHNANNPATLQQDFDDQRYGNAQNIPPSGREYTRPSKNERYQTHTRESLIKPFTLTEHNASVSNSSTKKNYKSHENRPPFSDFENREVVDDGNGRNSFPSTNREFEGPKGETHFNSRGSLPFSDRENRKQSDDGVKRARKRKKLRIVVKRLEDEEEESTFPTNDDKREIEERISKNVLKSLKSRLLQESIELQIQYQGHVWNVPFVSNESDLSPSVCTRAGLFQHPRDCNAFYECFWDKWLKRFTLHVFACPVRLVYDQSVRGCSRPSLDAPCNDKRGSAR